MIILGAGVNHWYHMDMNYRGMINMLIFCGCVEAKRWRRAHYVGQKTAPTNRLVATGLCARLEPTTAPNEQHLVFYNHSSQWRYEKVSAQELLSPLADASKYSGHLIDFNVRAERMGWLPLCAAAGA